VGEGHKLRRLTGGLVVSLPVIEMATARLGAAVRVMMPGRVEMRLPTLSSSIGAVSLTAAALGRMVTEAWPMAAAASAAAGVIVAARRTAAMKPIRRLEVSAGIVPHSV